MPKGTHKRSKKAGLPPGTLVHIGKQMTEQVNVRMMDYDEQRLIEKEITALEICSPKDEKTTVTWIDIIGVHEVDIIEKIGKHFELHPLTLEDIVNTRQRPKIEEFDTYLYIVLKMLFFDETENKIQTEQISLILGPRCVISFQETEKDVFDFLRERIRKSKGRIRKSGADYLAYALIDAIVDSYFSILEKIGEEIERIENDLISEPKTETLHELHDLKREMIHLRKSVWPLREVVNNLLREEYDLIQEPTRLFLRDVYDHTIQVIDTIETYRDMLSGLLDLYLSSISNKMNEVMKVLTIIATIFIPITFVAGIYGMNFENMPELKWPLGYFLAWMVMLVIAVIMLFYFRKKKWL